MMVERLPYTESEGQLLKALDQATIKLTQIGQTAPDFSPKEAKELIKILQHVNTVIDPSILSGKTLVLEGMNTSIEKALKAIQLFEMNQPQTNRGAQKNVDQAVTSLFSTLSKEIKDFDKNIRNLKKHKIGLKIEKVEEIHKSKKDKEDKEDN